MQAVESETLTLYHTELRGHWPQAPAHALASRLRYARRLAVSRGGREAHASLAGIALALRALSQLLGRSVAPGEIVFAHGEKPRLASHPALAVAVAGTLPEARTTPPPSGADFSIAHSGRWVACAALARGRVGLDVEMGTDARIADWVVREAALKANGEGLRAAREVRELEWDTSGACWRGVRWHLRRLDLFPGASACVLSSVALAAVEARAVSLAELFAP
jgi:phosphopantetheinyl transferase